MGAFCSCTRGEVAVAFERNLPESHVFPNRWAAEVSPRTDDVTFLEASRDMDHMAVPGSSIIPNGADDVFDNGGRRQGMGSRRSLGESGIGSTGMSSTLGSHRSVTLSMPATPHAIRQKPPPKPPRLRQMSASGVTPPISPGHPPHSPASTVSNKSSFFEPAVDTSFQSLPTDMQPISRVYPSTTQDKVYSIILQSKDILINEICASTLVKPLRSKNIIDDRAVAELQAVTNENAANALLLDILMNKSHEEFLTFCEVLRFTSKSSIIPDLLLSLDCLVDIKPHPKGPSCEAVATQWNGAVSLVDEGPCTVCTTEGASPASTDFGLDTTNFDVEIIYIDKHSGDVRTLHEVASCKREKRDSLANGQYRNSITSDVVRYEADRYVPVITVGLYNYCLWGTNIEKVGRALYKRNAVRELSLAKCHLNAQSLKLLAHVVQSNQGLHKLDLRLNHLDEAAMAELAEGLRKCTCIRVLNLSSTELSPGGCKALVQSVVRNQSTNDIDIGFNDLQNKGCDIIAEALAQNCPIRRLRVRHNGITSDGAFHLSRALKKNAHLSFLDLSCNNLGDKSMIHMSEMLRYNRTVKQLNLEKCNISKDGCVALVRALKSNTSLRQLTMSMNPLGDGGVEALSDGLKYNQTLDVLCLNMCGVTNEGFLGMLEALQFNMTLKVLKLCYNKIGMVPVAKGDEAKPNPVELVYAKLCHILQHNKDLKVLLWGNRLDDDEDLSNNFDHDLVSLSSGPPDFMSDSMSYPLAPITEVSNGLDGYEPASLPGDLGLHPEQTEAKSSQTIHANGDSATNKFVEQYMIHGSTDHALASDDSTNLMLQIPNGSLQQIQNRIQVSPRMGMSSRATKMKTSPSRSANHLDVNFNRSYNDSQASIATLKAVTFGPTVNLPSSYYPHAHPHHQSKIRTNGSLPRKPKTDGGLALATDDGDYPTWPRQSRQHKFLVKNYANSPTSLFASKPA